MNTTWRIELLGGLQVQAGEKMVTHFRTRGASRLLARLALTNAPTRREALIEWLWPDSSFEAGRNRLSVALSALRRELFVGERPPLLHSNHDDIKLNFEEVRTDVGAFTSALRLAHHAPDDGVARAMESALSLWGGPLLPGFEDAWFAPHARRLNEEFITGTCRLAELAPEKALPFLHRARSLDPAHEEVVRALLRILTRSGQLEEARQEWRSLEATLRRNHSRAPSEDTKRLAGSLLKTRPASEARGTTKSLPSSPNRFFGREEELAALGSWLQPTGGARLVTLWGSGGTGKTRLALEAARALSPQFGGDVFFVPMENVSRAEQLAEALGSALKVPRERVLPFLNQRHALLVLDCVEHLLEDGAGEVARLLDAAPTTSLLVTTRRVLGLDEERVLALAPLPLPRLEEGETATASPDGVTLDEWARSAAVRLFFDRARLARPSFRLHIHNARDVVSVCRALEGVPLAIELAAGRTLALSPAQVLLFLNERLDFLKRTTPVESVSSDEARHTSLRVVIDWSFELLSPDARATLGHLSVFRGGWTLPAAMAVCAPRDSPQTVRRTLEALEELRRHALLDGEEVGGEMRFRLSDTVRQYALEQANSRDDARTRRALRRRHALEFARLAENFARDGRNRTSDGWFARLEHELPNLREALDWALAHDKTLALRLAASLWWFWFGSSRLSEGRQALARALETPAKTTKTGDEGINWQAEALSGAGFLAWRQGDLSAAVAHSRQAIELARTQSEHPGAGHALIYSQLVILLTALVQGDTATAKALGDECLRLSRARDDQHGEAFALHLLGSTADVSGDAHTAWTLQEQSGTLFGAIGSSEGQAWSLFNWSIAARHLGDFSRALELCEASRRLFQQLGSPEGCAYCDLHAGLALERRASVEENAAFLTDANDLLRRAVNEFWRLNALWGLALAIEGCAMVCARDASARATRLWSAAKQLRQRIGTPVPPVDAPAFAVVEETLRACAGELSFEAQSEMGRRLTIEQIVRDANLMV